MAFPQKRRTVTYIVRIWAEYLSEQPPRWRGVIEPVGAGKERHFSNLDQLVEFILQNTHHPSEKENKT